MSKAFTRESDASGAEETASFRLRRPQGFKNYITRDGADRLKQRLNELREKKRELAAAGHEDSPASEADRQMIESAIRTLQQTLDSVIVAEIPTDREKVAFGATVVIRRGNGEEETYQILGVEEANPECGRISWISPLARALLSRRAGEKLRFLSPAGVEELTILKVSYSEH